MDWNGYIGYVILNPYEKAQSVLSTLLTFKIKVAE